MDFIGFIGLVVRGAEWLFGRWAKEKEALRRARLIADDLSRIIDLARRCEPDQDMGRQTLLNYDQRVRETLIQWDDSRIRELAMLLEDIQRGYPRGITRRSEEERSELLERVEALRVHLGGKAERS